MDARIVVCPVLQDKSPSLLHDEEEREALIFQMVDELVESEGIPEEAAYTLAQRWMTEEVSNER